MTAGYPPNELYSAISFIGFVVSFIPWFWHCKVTSIPTCLFLTWTWLLCLVYFTNSVVWNNNTINSAPIWCDISTRIIVGGNVGFPISCLLLQRRLYKVASFSQVVHKRRELAIELGPGIGLPLLEIVLQYFMQGHRFDIAEELGCLPAVDLLPWTFPLYTCASLIIGLGGAIYGGLAFVHVLNKRRALREALPTYNHVDYPIDRHFMRVLILASVNIFFTIAIGSIVVAFNVTNGLYHYRGWAELKYKYSAVYAFPTALWRLYPLSAAGSELSRWYPIICAFVIFVLFGFAEDAKEKYRAGWRVVKVTARRFLPKNIQNGVGKLFERRTRSQQVLKQITFAGSPVSKTSSLTTVSLENDTSSQEANNDPAPSEIHNPSHAPRTYSDNIIALPETSHQDVTAVLRTTDIVRASVGRQSVRLLPNGTLDIAFTPDAEKDPFWLRPGEIGSGKAS